MCNIVNKRSNIERIKLYKDDSYHGLRSHKHCRIELFCIDENDNN